MSQSRNEIIKRFRANRKKVIITSMGGCCQVCGYDKCQAALELHHLNPEEKDFAFNKIAANNKSWPKIVVELKKCVLLCSNCHTELHNGYTVLPEKYKTFDKKFEKYEDVKKLIDLPNGRKCEICGKNLINSQYYTCSKICGGKSKKSDNLDLDNIKIMYYDKGLSLSEVARRLDCSTMTIRKFLIKNNLKILPQTRFVTEKPPKQELEKLIWEKPISIISKELKVSHDSIRKWIKSYDIEKPPIGYWQKNKYSSMGELVDPANC